MLQLKNTTPFPSTMYLFPDEEGVDSLYVVVKGTFVIGERLSLSELQVPVRVAEEYHGDPALTSIRTPSDVSLIKPGTDVLLQGSAHAPGGRPTTEMEVSLAVGPVRKAVRVFGDRVWERRTAGHSMSAPARFERMPLVWERAFGGSDQRGAEVHVEPRNPAGAGYTLQGGIKNLDGLLLPNVEDPQALIRSARDAPPPAGFAPISAHWQPRQAYAGTYDQAWQQQRAPYLPTDFDTRFCQLAPPGLIVPGYLQAGALVEARGVTASGVLRVALPPVRVEITYIVDHAPQVRPANLDTVLIEPDEHRLVLVWRAVLRCDKKALRVNEVRPAVLRAA